MRNAILLLVAVLVACSGRAGSAVLGDAGGPATGMRLGRGLVSDGSMLADVRRSDAQRVNDLLVVPDALLAPDARPVVSDVLAVADVVTDVARDAVPADSLRDSLSPDGAPWGRLDDAGLLHCDSNYISAARNILHHDAGTEGCDYSKENPPGGQVRCWRDLTGLLPASCRYDASDVAWAWYVRTCADCAGLEKWTSVPGGAP